MKYFRYMWIGSSLDEQRAELFRQLNENTAPEEIFLIGVPEEKTHLLNIYPGEILEKKYFRESGELVIGAAGSKEEAEEMAGGIIKLVYDRTGGYDILSYIREAEEAEVTDDR